MNSSVNRFTLDLNSTQSQVSIPVMLGDTSREFRINLSSGENQYPIVDGCLAKISIKRPTGTRLEEFCTIENNTTIVYRFSQNVNTAAVEGMHECDVTLYGLDGGNIASSRFTMVVSERVVVRDDVVLEDDDFTAVDAMLREEAQRQADELSRHEAENRREQADDKRDIAESKREAAEAERRLAEAQRKVAEAQRALGGGGGSSLNFNKSVKKRPFVTFVDDDGKFAVMRKLLPLTRFYGIGFCSAMITNRIGTPTNMSASDLRTLQESGWEISSHTDSHRDLGRNCNEENPKTKKPYEPGEDGYVEALDLRLYESQDAELRKSKEILEDIGVKVDSVCYPGGNFDETTFELMRKYYKYGRGSNSGRGVMLNDSPLNTYDLVSIPFGSKESKMGGFPHDYPFATNSMEHYKYMVQKAVEEKAWLIFTIHSDEWGVFDQEDWAKYKQENPTVKDSDAVWNYKYDAFQQDYHNRWYLKSKDEALAKELEELVQFILDYEDEEGNKATIATMREVIAERGNLFDIGYKWDYDATTPHFAVGFDGTAMGNNLPVLLAKQNEYDGLETATDYPKYKIVVCDIHRTKALVGADNVSLHGFPAATGTLIAVRTHNNTSGLYTKRFFMNKNNSSIFVQDSVATRQPDGTYIESWGAWIPLNSTICMSEADLLEDSKTLDEYGDKIYTLKQPQSYPSGTVSVCRITKETQKYFPEQSLGILKVTSSINGSTYNVVMEFTTSSTFRKYTCFSSNARTWTPWRRTDCPSVTTKIRTSENFKSVSQKGDLVFDTDEKKLYWMGDGKCWYNLTGSTTDDPIEEEENPGGSATTGEVTFTIASKSTGAIYEDVTIVKIIDSNGNEYTPSNNKCVVPSGLLTFITDSEYYLSDPFDYTLTDTHVTQGHVTLKANLVDKWLPVFFNPIDASGNAITNATLEIRDAAGLHCPTRAGTIKDADGNDVPVTLYGFSVSGYNFYTVTHGDYETYTDSFRRTQAQFTKEESITIAPKLTAKGAGGGATPPSGDEPTESGVTFNIVNTKDRATNELLSVPVKVTIVEDAEGNKYTVSEGNVCETLTEPGMYNIYIEADGYVPRVIRGFAINGVHINTYHCVTLDGYTMNKDTSGLGGGATPPSGDETTESGVTFVLKPKNCAPPSDYLTVSATITKVVDSNGNEYPVIGNRCPTLTAAGMYYLDIMADGYLTKTKYGFNVNDDHINKYHKATLDGFKMASRWLPVVITLTDETEGGDGSTIQYNPLEDDYLHVSIKTEKGSECPCRLNDDGVLEYFLDVGNNTYTIQGNSGVYVSGQFKLDAAAFNRGDTVVIAETFAKQNDTSGATFVVNAIDIITGEPLSGAMVTGVRDPHGIEYPVSGGRCPTLTVGAYYLNIELDGYLPKTLARAIEEDPNGQTITINNVSMSSRWIPVTLTAKDIHGEDIPGAYIAGIVDSSGSYCASKTEGDKTFYYFDLGEHTYTVAADGYTSFSDVFTMNQLDFDRQTTVSLVVTLSNGNEVIVEEASTPVMLSLRATRRAMRNDAPEGEEEEVEGATVAMLTDAEGNDYLASDGICYLSGAGDYTATVIADDYLPTTLPCSVTEENLVNGVVLRLSAPMSSKWLPVVLDATDGNGNAVLHAVLESIEDVYGNKIESKVEDGVTKYCFDPGDYTYKVTAEGYGTAIAIFTLYQTKFDNCETVVIAPKMVSGGEPSSKVVAFTINARDLIQKDKKVSVTIDNIYNPSGNLNCAKKGNGWALTEAGKYRLTLSADGYFTRTYWCDISDYDITSGAITLDDIKMTSKFLLVKVEARSRSGYIIPHARIPQILHDDGSIGRVMQTDEGFLCEFEIGGNTYTVTADGYEVTEICTSWFNEADFVNGDITTHSVRLSTPQELEVDASKVYLNISAEVYGVPQTVSVTNVSVVDQEGKEYRPDVRGYYYLPIGTYDIALRAYGYYDTVVKLERTQLIRTEELFVLMYPRTFAGVKVDVSAIDYVSGNQFVPEIVVMKDSYGREYYPVEVYDKPDNDYKLVMFDLYDDTYTITLHADGYEDVTVKRTITQVDVLAHSVHLDAVMKMSEVALNVPININAKSSKGYTIAAWIEKFKYTHYPDGSPVPFTYELNPNDCKNADGTFVLYNGKYTVTLDANYHDKKTYGITVKGNATKNINVTMPYHYSKPSFPSPAPGLPVV